MHVCMYAYIRIWVQGYVYMSSYQECRRFRSLRFTQGMARMAEALSCLLGDLIPSRYLDIRILQDFLIGFCPYPRKRSTKRDFRCTSAGKAPSLWTTAGVGLRGKGLGGGSRGTGGSERRRTVGTKDPA